MAAGITVYGVSFDSVEANRRFAAAYGFNFKLICDVSREIGVAYGAADARDEAYAKRIGYLIDRGVIARAYRVRDAGGHAGQVLEDASR